MAEQKTIMVVDDKESIRKHVSSILKKEGYNVVEAVNGDDCIKKLPEQKIDLILLDIMMPGMPVKEVVRKAKGTKIIYLSGVGVTEAEKKELQRIDHIKGFISKPFKEEDLIERVKKALRKKWVFWMF